KGARHAYIAPTGARLWRRARALDARGAAIAWARRASNDRDLGAATGLRAFAHPTRRGGERHGYANTGLELARANHSPGRRRERNRAEGAAAAGAELDLEQTRDACAAGAPGAALFDARRGLARIWRGGAPATRLDARRLRRLPGFSPHVRHRASPRDRRRRARRDLRSQTRRQRVGAG